MNARLLMVGMMVLGAALAWGQEEVKPIEPAEERSPEDAVAADPDPFGVETVRGSGPLEAERGELRTASVVVRFETFEIPTVRAVEFLDGWAVSEGADGLRKQILELVKSEEGTIRDMKAATIEVGTKAVLEGIHEFIYPTEYEAPGLGSVPDPDLQPETALGKLIQSVNDNFMPTAFETRNTGSTLEFEVGLVTAEAEAWDVRLAPEVVEFVGMEVYGPEGMKAEMPGFNSTRTSSSLRVRDGIWSLVTAQTPYKGKERNEAMKQFQFVKVERAR